MHKVLSIITVTMNNPDEYRATENSLRGIVGGSTEWIVVNGGGSLQYELVPDVVIEEPDEGIYDAMAKGCKRATGKYIQFLNSGDQFLSVFSHQLITNRICNESVGYIKTCAIIIDPNSGKFALREPRADFPYIFHGVTANQQAVFYLRSAIVPNLDAICAYRICGDYALECLLYKQRVSSLVLNVVSVVFYRGGISTSRFAELGFEAALIQRNILRLGSVFVWLSRLLRWISSRRW